MKKSPIDEPFAREDLVWVKEDGVEVAVTAKIGRPYQRDEISWACPAELRGLDGQYPDIVGSSSIQALCLAIQLIKSRIGHLIEDGECLYGVEDRNSKWDKKLLDAVFGK